MNNNNNNNKNNNNNNNNNDNNNDDDDNNNNNNIGKEFSKHIQKLYLPVTVSTTGCHLSQTMANWQLMLAPISNHPGVTSE